jgi:general secretion pathway protein A
MFQEFYGFARNPFSKTIPTQDLFPAAGQAELSARLTYLLRDHGFGLVTGEVGSGKSTAVRAFAASLDPNRYLLLYVANPTIGITGIYRELLAALGQQVPFGKPRMVAHLRSAFLDLALHKHRAPVVILDEAHLLSQPMLEQLRLLFSDQMDSHSLATLLLVGHPDLRRTLRLAVHEPLAQRLSVRYHLGPLDLAETLAYVKHQVRVAGYTAGPLFTDDAIARLFDYTKGLPRRINQVCTTALMAGLIEKKNLIDESTLRKAIAEIDQE